MTDNVCCWCQMIYQALGIIMRASCAKFQFDPFVSRKLGWRNGRKLAITWVQGMTYSARYTIRAFGTKRETKGSN
eukprot:scaffold212142_cov28-Attheya_sp.AAC.1